MSDQQEPVRTPASPSGKDAISALFDIAEFRSLTVKYKDYEKTNILLFMIYKKLGEIKDEIFKDRK